MRIRVFFLSTIVALGCYQPLFAYEGEVIIPSFLVPSKNRLSDAINNNSDTPFFSSPRMKKVTVEPLSQCFTINRVVLHHQERFASQPIFNKWKAQIEGHCHSESLLEQDINILNAMLFDAGYVTSRVGKVDLFADEHLLDITLNVGTIEDVVVDDENKKPALISQAIPAKKGDVLNIYDIEQGIANLRNRPKSRTKIELKPVLNNKEESTKTIVSISQIGERTFGGSFEINNKEQPAYGNLFGVAKLGFGNLLQLNEQLFVITSSDLDTRRPQGIKKQIFLLQIPYQYWRLALFGYNVESKSKVMSGSSGLQETRQQHLSLDIQRFFRPSSQRTVILAGGLQYYTYQNTILGQHISVHQRRSPYITASIEQDYRFVRGGSLRTKFHYKQSVPLQGAKLSPIESVNGVPIFNFSLDASFPFMAISQPLIYQSELDIQLTKANIDGLLDNNTIGGFNTVYGFPLGKGYSDINQFVLRQKLSWIAPVKSQLFNDQVIFSALDYGSVSEQRGNIFHNQQKYLVGAALGLEGSIKQLSYQLSWGIPLLMPKEKERSATQFHFNGQWNF